MSQSPMLQILDFLTFTRKGSCHKIATSSEPYSLLLPIVLPVQPTCRMVIGHSSSHAGGSLLGRKVAQQ